MWRIHYFLIRIVVAYEYIAKFTQQHMLHSTTILVFSDIPWKSSTMHNETGLDVTKQGLIYWKMLNIKSINAYNVDKCPQTMSIFLIYKKWFPVIFVTKTQKYKSHWAKSKNHKHISLTRNVLCHFLVDYLFCVLLFSLSVNQSFQPSVRNILGIS